MNILDAIEKHIDQQWNGISESTKASHLRFEGEPMTRDYLLSEGWSGEGGGQFGIAREVGLRVASVMGEFVSYDVFDNCREHGLTFAALGPDLLPAWTFSVYEHRNSDQICIQGCRTDEVKSYGTWPDEEVGKYDVLHSSDWMDYDSAATALIALLEAVATLEHPNRGMLKHIADDAVRNHLRTFEVAA